ncbi:hypothetical protein [Streptomyces sp. NPDC088135]|uniref:hypothetical protein n=1 Tax=Streptomyces sp. NPDC088135 TaxID=3160993 RepID=UPI0034204353
MTTVAAPWWSCCRSASLSWKRAAIAVWAALSVRPRHQTAAADEQGQGLKAELALVDGDPPQLGVHGGHLELAHDAVQDAPHPAAGDVDLAHHEQVAGFALQGPGCPADDVRTFEQAEQIGGRDGILGNIDGPRFAVFRAGLDDVLGRPTRHSRPEPNLRQ